MDEWKLKEIGERLATEAVKVGVGSGHLKRLYRSAKKESVPIPFIKAWIEHQVARSAQRKRGSPRGFDIFGPKILEELERFKENRPEFVKALKYANMYYEYVKMSATRVHDLKKPNAPPDRDRLRSGDTDDSSELRDRLEPIVSRVCMRYGLTGMRLSKEWRCNVRLRSFREDPRELSANLYRAVVSQFPELSGSIRFWIDRNERR